MSNHNEVLVKVAQDIRNLWPLIRGRGVAHVWVFGCQARGDGHPGSDLDLLVEFTSPPDFDNFMGLKFDLEDHLGTKIDLLSLTACTPRFLKAIQPDLLNVA